MQMEVSFKNKLASQMEEQRNFLRQDFLKEKLNLITDTGETSSLTKYRNSLRRKSKDDES